MCLLVWTCSSTSGPYYHLRLMASASPTSPAPRSTLSAIWQRSNTADCAVDVHYVWLGVMFSDNLSNLHVWETAKLMPKQLRFELYSFDLQDNRLWDCLFLWPQHCRLNVITHLYCSLQTAVMQTPEVSVASFADKLQYKMTRALVSGLFASMWREVSSWGKNTNHLSDQLEASRKLHTKHVALLLTDEPLLRRNSHQSQSELY